MEHLCVQIFNLQKHYFYPKYIFFKFVPLYLII